MDALLNVAGAPQPAAPAFEGDHLDELLDALESNFVNWSGSMVSVTMHNPDRPHMSAPAETVAAIRAFL